MLRHQLQGLPVHSKPLRIDHCTMRPSAEIETRISPLSSPTPFSRSIQHSCQIGAECFPAQSLECIKLHFLFLKELFCKNTGLIFAQNLRTTPASATKNNTKNNGNRINFKSKKKLNSLLIQNDEIRVMYNQNYNNSKTIQSCCVVRRQQKFFWLLFE